MDPQEPFFFSNNPSPTKKSPELHGPRPSPLQVNKASHKIKKPPIPPPNHHHSPPPRPYTAAGAGATTSQNPQPVIIYSISPKVIHTTVSDFMSLVQSLTGSSSTATTDAATDAGDVSPAARFASIENTSPSQRERERQSSLSAATTATAAVHGSTATHGIEYSHPFERERFYSGRGVAGEVDGAGEYRGDDGISRILDESNYFSQNYFPGILSPAPATLLPASPAGLFSPAAMDPFSNMFIPSPSTLFSAPMVSPSPSSSYSHLFNSLFDF